MFLGLFHIFLLPTEFFRSVNSFFYIPGSQGFPGACEPCYRFPPAKNQTKTEKISIITARMMLAAYCGLGPFSLDKAIRKMIRG